MTGRLSESGLRLQVKGLQERVYELEQGLLHVQNYVWLAQRYGVLSRKVEPEGPLDVALGGIDQVVRGLVGGVDEKSDFGEKSDFEEGSA